jgi:SAM-dependent methyltransferase
MGASASGDGFKRLQAQGWSDRAETYGDLLGAVTARAAEPLVDAAGIRAGTKVLDVATGPGYVAERAAGRGAEVIGIDIAEGMVELARRRRPELEFRCGDAEALPFEDATFDAVLGGFVIAHVLDPERAVAEAVRVLRPGGSVAFSLWDRPERNRMNGVFSDAVTDAGLDSDTAEPVAGPDSYRFSDDAALAALLEDAGLVEVEVETLALAVSVPDTDAAWNGLLGSTVRMRALHDAQSEATRARIRAAFDRRCEMHTHDDGVRLPAVAKLGSARLA